MGETGETGTATGKEGGIGRRGGTTTETGMTGTTTGGRGTATTRTGGGRTGTTRTDTRVDTLLRRLPATARDHDPGRPAPTKETRGAGESTGPGVESTTDPDTELTGRVSADSSQFDIVEIM